MPKKIEYKGSNVYVLRVPVGHTQRGYVKTTNKRVVANSMAEAQALYYKYEAGVKAEIESSGATPKTVKELVEHWFENVGNIGRKNTTIATDRHTSQRIIEALGDLHVRKVTYTQLNRFTANLIDEQCRNNSGRALSNRTVRMHQDFLKKLFDYAVKIGLRLDNPTEHMTFVKKSRKKIALPNMNFIKDYVQTIDEKSTNLRCAAYLALALGLRRGEICGLRWQDVDFQSNIIMVKWNRVKYDKAGTVSKNAIIVGASILQSPKSEEGDRQVAVPNEIMEELRELKLLNDSHKAVYQSVPGYEPIFSEFLILNEATGRPINVDTLSRFTGRISKCCGREGFTTHKLRHLATSVMLDQKLPVNVVQSVLGHADSKTTLDIYAHLLRPVNTEAAQIMGNFLQNMRK